ncbi:MAG: hypothetical protein HUJ65_08180, partial [Oscillospiraceae bacterium]|nr:hypothetical protein [Oscillospiraceae bacterium]
MLAAQGADCAVSAKLSTWMGVITSARYDGSDPTVGNIGDYHNVIPAEGTRYLKTADSNFITFGVTVEDTRPEDYISGETKGTISEYELKFAGWYEDDSYSGDAVTTFSDNRFYYAKWMYGTQMAYNRTIFIEEDGCYYLNELNKYVAISEGAGWKYYQEASGDYEAHTLVLDGAFILGPECAISIIDSDSTIITENDSIAIGYARQLSSDVVVIVSLLSHSDFEGPGVLRATVDNSASIITMQTEVALGVEDGAFTIKSGAAVIATAPDTENSSSSCSVGAYGEITVEDGAVFIAQGAFYGYYGSIGKLTTSGEELIYYSEYYDGSGSSNVPASDYADGADFEYENKYFRINSPAEINDYGVTVTGVNPKKYVSGTTKGYAGDCELTFAGWYEDIDYTGDAAVSVENGKTYYAKWMHGTTVAYPNGLYISDGVVYDYASMQPCNEGPGWKYYPEATDDYDARTLVLDGAVLLSQENLAIGFMDTKEPISPYTIVTKSDSYIYGGKDSEYKFVSFGGTVNFEGPGTLTIEGDAISRYKFCAPIYTDSGALTVKDGASVIVKTPEEKVDEEYDYVAIYMEDAALTVEEGGSLIAQGADYAFYATLVTPCAVIVSENYDGSDATTEEAGTYASGAVPSMGTKYLEINGKPKF